MYLFQDPKIYMKSLYFSKLYVAFLDHVDVPLKDFQRKSSSKKQKLAPTMIVIFHFPDFRAER